MTNRTMAHWRRSGRSIHSACEITVEVFSQHIVQSSIGALLIAQGTRCEKLLSARLRQDWRDISRLEALFAAYNKDQSAGAKDGLPPPNKSSWRFTFVDERNEHRALCQAIPDLEWFARNERRARSRQKRRHRQTSAKAISTKRRVQYQMQLKGAVWQNEPNVT
jgi:hypothetical protein